MKRILVFLAGLAIMVGASPAAFERCRPYLSAVGKTVVRVGDVRVRAWFFKPSC